MIQRTLGDICFSQEFGRQMRFIAGPRQAGKTTLAKTLLHGQSCDSFYYNWDDRSIRRRYRQDPQFIWADLKSNAKNDTHPKRWICFDEIHKMPQWKNILKGMFDSLENEVQMVVTGSARLDYFRRSGDSLAGRYFLFHLLPVALRELTASSKSMIQPLKNPFQFIKERLAQSQYAQEAMESLLQWSGFPEPLLKATTPFNRKWHQDYMERLVREDIRDMTQIHDLESVAHLISLLPDRVGSPLSLNSLREDLEVSHTAVRNYVKALELTYILFSLAPYSKKIQRSIRKEKKIYFFDWASISDPGSRFENYVACELLGWITAWNDAGLGRFELHYVRTRLGKETDFLITQEGTPWMLLEAKLSDPPIESHHFQHAQALGKIPVVQLVQTNNVTRKQADAGYIISASRFLKK